MEYTGVMQEIEELLDQGNTSRQVIDLGYAPGTVYGVQRRVRRQSSKQENNGAHNQATEQSADIAPFVEDIVERVDRLEELMETAVMAKDDIEDIAVEHLNGLTQQVDLVAGKLEGLPERCEKLETLCSNLNEAHNGLVGMVGQNHEAVNKHFALQKDGAKSTDTRLRELEALTRRLGKKIEANSAIYTQLTNRLNAMDQKASRFEAELRTLRNQTLRQPTGELVSARLTDKRDHNFKEYKSPMGLAKPYKHSHDLFLGNRWIDLAEPEN